MRCSPRSPPGCAPSCAHRTSSAGSAAMSSCCCSSMRRAPPCPLSRRASTMPRAASIKRRAPGTRPGARRSARPSPRASASPSQCRRQLTTTSSSPQRTARSTMSNSTDAPAGPSRTSFRMTPRRQNHKSILLHKKTFRLYWKSGIPSATIKIRKHWEIASIERMWGHHETADFLS